MSETLTLNELDQQLKKGREELKAMWDGFGTKEMPDGTKAPAIPANALEEINKRNDELNELGKKRDSLLGAQSQIEALSEKNQPVNRLGQISSQNQEKKSLADQVMESQQYKDRSSNGFRAVDVKGDFLGLERKAVMTTQTGYVVENTRDGDYVPYLNVSNPNVINLVPVQRTDNETITYVRQTERTNAAAAKKEGQALAQSSFKVETVTDPLRYVGHYMDVTLAQLSDVAQAQALLNQELPAMVREELERLYLVGSGSGNEFFGVYNDANAQTQAKGTNSIIDVFREAIGKVEDYSNDQRPNLIVMRPWAWRNIELQKTADGNYIFSNPASITTPRLWGYQVATSQNLATATALVMDSRFFPLVYREGMQIDSTEADGEKFQNLIVTMRAFVRAGVKHRRGQAACKVTGLTES